MNRVQQDQPVKKVSRHQGVIRELKLGVKLIVENNTEATMIFTTLFYFKITK